MYGFTTNMLMNYDTGDTTLYYNRDNTIAIQYRHKWINRIMYVVCLLSYSYKQVTCWISLLTLLIGLQNIIAIAS